MVVVGSYTGQGWMVNAGAAMALGAVTERKPKNERRLVSHSAMIRSAIQPQEVLYGRPSKKGGVVTWFGTSGGRQEYLWYVITVCEHEIDGFEKLWIDDVEIDIATEITANEVTKDDFVDSDGNRLVKAWFYTGTDGQTANADLVSAFTEWTTDHRGRGVAYFVVRLEIDTSSGGNDPDDPGANVWSKGAPRELAVTVRGKKVYDPRLDSTNGGSGTHRLADPTTWEWSQNPALCRADYLMSSRFGPGLASSEIDWSLVATAADLCDEQVAIDAESPATEQDRYQINGVASVDQTPKSILESIHTADHGTTVISAEGARIYSGGWNASVHNVDESWLAGAASVQSAVAADATYNAVRGRYLQPDGQSVEFAPKTASAYESEDGGFRVWRDIDLPWTTDNYMAQRLGIIELKKSRQQTVVNLLCNYRAELVQVWDIASLTIDEAGFDAATFRVIGKTTSQDGTVTLQLRQEAESDWSFTIPDLAEPPVVPSVTRNPAGIPAPSGLASTTVGDGIRLEWDNPNMGSVSHIEVWAATTNDRSTATLVTRTASESFVQALAEDTVRYHWILARGYNGLVSAWHPVGSTDGVYGIAGGSGQGAQGDPGAPALDGFANVDGPAAWVRDQDGSTWNPTATTTDIDWTFAIAGTAVARISRRVTRSAAGLLTVSTTTHPAGDLNTGRVTITITGGGTRAVTLVAAYDHDGYQKAIAQGVVASLSGTDGDDGIPREGFLLNGGFETNSTQHWVAGAGGTGLTTVATPVFSGTYAARVGLAVNASSTVLEQVVLSPPAGTQLRFIARVQRNESSLPNRDLILQARFGDSPAGGGLISLQNIATASSGVSGWQLLTGTVLVPAGAQSVAFRFAKANPQNTDESGQWFIDDCWLYQEGADGEPGLTFSISNPSMTIACDAGGTPLAGAFDSAVGQFTVFSGATDVTASCTFSAVQSNVTGSINTATNTPVTGAKGSYRITALGAETGYLEMTAVYNGQTIKARFSVSKARRGSAATFAQDTSLSNVTQTSYPSTGQGGPIQIAVQGGTVKVAASGAYRGTTNAAGQTTTLTGKIQYREVGSGTWIDFPGAVATGTQAYYDGNDLIWYPGVLSITEQTMSGPVDPEVWEFQLVMYRSAGNATTTTFPSGGSLTAEWVSS